MWKKYCTDGHATDDNIIRRMRMACWVNKVTDTHTEYVWSSTATVVNANASQCYVYTYNASRSGLNLIVIWKKNHKSIISLFSDGSSPLCIYN